MGFKTFNAGDALTANDVNSYLMQQVVIVCTSGSRPGSPVEGMTIAETDTDQILTYSGSGWVVIGYYGSRDPVEVFQTANDTVSSTSYVTGSSHGTAFVAPPSGKVYVTFGGDIGHNSASTGVTAYLSDVVRTGSTVGSGTTVASASDDRAAKFIGDGYTAAGFRYRYGTVRHLVTGLTFGSSYNVTTVFRVDTAAVTAAVNDRRLLVEPVL